MKKIIILAVVIVAVLGFFLVNQLASFGVLDEDAYAITDDVVTKNLKSDTVDPTQSTIELKKFNALDEVYKSASQIVLGEEKTAINQSFPLYVKNTSAILTVGSDAKLINTEFNSVDSYYGLYVSGGKSFNNDGQLADFDDFILLSMPNGLYMNMKGMTIQGPSGAVNIALNSIVAFKNNAVSFYQPDGHTLIYGSIAGLDEDSWIQVGADTYNYFDFLKRLGLMQDALPPVPTPTPVIISSQPIPLPTPEPSVVLEKPEEPAPPDNEVGESVPPGYVKPEVTCGELTPYVYGVKTAVTVKDPAGRIKNGVRFEFYRNGTELFWRKAVSSTGGVDITPLPPDTSFRVVCLYSYFDEKNRLVEEVVREQTVKTRPLSDLAPMELSFENGLLFYNKIQIKNLVFAGSPELTGKDTVQYVSKLNIKIGDSMFSLDSASLKSMKSGTAVTYDSPTALKSATEYAYVLTCEDRYGNALPLVKPAEGKTATCKIPPKATLTLQDRTVKTNQTQIQITNTDSADMANCRLLIFDELTGQQIAFSADDGTTKSEMSTAFAFDKAGVTVKLPDLPLNTALKLIVLCDYDIADGKGMQNSMEIGSLRIVTADLSTLGKVFFGTTVDEMKDTEANFSITFDAGRTNDVLEKLLNKVTVSAVNVQTGETTATMEISGDAAMASLLAQTPFKAKLTGLKSMTDYKLVITAEATYMGTIYAVSTYNNLDTFKTMRQEPIVKYSDYTATAQFIELYEVLIDDPDGTLMDDEVALTVADGIGRIVDSRVLKPNTMYPSLQFSKLEPGTMYTFTFTAVQYNNGYTLSTYKKMVKLKPVIQIETIDGVSGKISLRGLGYEPEGNPTTRSMKATLRVELQDKLNQLNPPTGESAYTLKVFRGDEQTATVVRPITARPLDEEFSLVVDRYFDYRVELWVHMNNHDLFLDSVEFESDEPIIGLKTIGDFAQLRTATTAKYIVLNDINFTQGPWNNDANPFNGELDFQGYKATFTGNNYLIYNLGRNGVVKNMVADIDVTSDDAIRYRGYVAYVNNGTIKNVMINLKGCKQMFHNSLGLISRVNNPTGVVENFVINLEKPIYVRAEFGCVAYVNYGIIRSGCVYGASYNYAPTDIASDADIIVPRLDANMEHSNNRIGGVVGYNGNQGRIENVYSLVNIKINDNTSTGATISQNTIGVVCGENAAMVKNAFSVGEVRFENLASSAVPYRNLSYGPAVGSENTRLQTENVYYVSMYAHDTGILGYSYGNLINKKATRETLRDKYWHKRLLGGGFDTNAVTAGIFPIVNLPDCMPRQDRIALPSLTASSTQLASIIVEQQYEDYAVAVFTFKNPQAHIIKSISLQGLSATVISGTQFDANDMTRVSVRLDNPQKFLSSYTVTGFVYQELNTTVNIAQVVTNAPACEAEFFKPVKTINDWKAIKNSLTENYRLKADIDFTGAAATSVQITGNFTGKLDGGSYEVRDKQMVLTGIHKISNIKLGGTSGTAGVVQTLYGSISNLRIEHMDLSYNNGTYAGFVVQTSAGASLDNIHVEDASILAQNSNNPTADHRFGILVGNLNIGEMRNCSVNNSEIIDKTNANVYIGGLAGYGQYVRIENCYVSGLKIESTVAQGARGTGGIIGCCNGSEVYNVYAVGEINTVDQNTGGIIGYISGTSKLQRTWADMKIKSTVDRMGGLIGFNAAESAEPATLNSLVLGDLSSSVTGSGFIHRAVGSSLNYDSVFAWDGQRINGQIPKDAYNMVLADGTTVMAEADMKNDRFYTRQIRMGDAFDYSHCADMQLPPLYYSDGQSLLPYQTAHYPQTPNIEIVSLDARLVGTAYKIEITFKHDPGVHIENILGDYLSFIPTKITEVTEDTTVYQGNADMNAVERYWDAYKLTGVEYNGGQRQDLFAQVDFGAPIYKQIYNIADWKFAMKEEGRAQTYENFMLMGDVDFTGITAADTSYYDVKLNRLVGGGGAQRTIRNLTLNLSVAPHIGKSFINTINTDISGVSFENVNLTFNTGASYNGLVGRQFGSVSDMGFKNITFAGGGNYTGCFGFIRGAVKNVTVENFQKLQATGSYMGAFAGCVQDGSVRNITLTGKSGSPVNVYGVSYVGGIIGAALNTTSDSCSADYVKIRGTGSYVGGVIGYSSSPNGAETVVNSNMTVTNSWIRGGNDTYTSGSGTGGILGYGSIRNDYEHNIISRSENNTVIGVTNVGGIAGQAYSWYNRGSNVVNCKVFGTSNIGGAYGSVSQAVYINVTGTVVSTVYDSLSTGAETGLPLTTIPADQNMAIGGISGYRQAQGCSVYNCTIGGREATNVGGVVGDAYEGNICYNHATNSTVFGKTKIGGIVGQLRYNRIYSCCTNASVTASGNYAGGIAGYVIGNRILYGTSLGYVDGCYTVGNNITAADYASGIIGYVTGQHDVITYQNKSLLSAPVEVKTTSGTHGDMFAVIGDGTTVQRSRVSAYSMLSIAGSPTKYGSQLYTADNFSDSTTATLNALRFVDATMMGAAGDVRLYNNRLANTITNTYFTVTPSITGTPKYMPQVRLNGSTSYAAVPNQVQIPIPSGTVMLSAAMRPATLTVPDEPQVLPVPVFYAADAGKLNVEFDGVNDNTYFEVTGNEGLLAQHKVDSRVFTLSYDFKTPLTVTLKDGTGQEVSYKVDPSSVAMNVLTWGNDYYVISGKGVQSGRNGLLAGSFVNIANGKALSSNGTLYNLENGSSVGAVGIIALEDQAQPVYEFSYDGYAIKTYKYFSTSQQGDTVAVRDFRMFVKNGELAVMDAAVPTVFDGLVIDKAGAEEYLTVLGTGGALQDLKYPIKTPVDFKNSDIVQMSNNIGSSVPYVLVRYRDGSVAAFNYLTGELQMVQDVKSDMSLIDYAKDYFSTQGEIPMTNVSDGYIQFSELKEKLIIQAAENLTQGTEAQGTGAQNTGHEGSGGHSAGAQADGTQTQNGAGGKQDIQGNAEGGTASGDGKAQSEQSSGSAGLERQEDKRYIAVYDMATGAYVLYDEEAMLGSFDSRDDGGAENTSAELKKDEAQPKPIPIDYSNTVTPSSGLENDGQDGMLIVLVLIIAVGIMMLFIFDRRKRISKDKK